MKKPKEQKVKIIKDKEGVLFDLQIDPKVSYDARNKNSSLFARSIIIKKLNERNVYPENNKVGFIGEIESVSHFIGYLIDAYIKKYHNNN
jgi:hypothetical protein